MEVLDIQKPCKFPRINGRNVSTRMREDEGESAADGGSDRRNGWHHSRIIRVSRASGGKDRHSKVLTFKGLRDRRIRLSVATAIKFYDLQDRLGYDQPSKAVEWLIKASSDAIAELPSLNNSFPKPINQISDGKTELGFDSAEVDLSKSGCSSNSETSKGSGIGLSISEIRVKREKARERARERVEKEKEREQNENSITQNASFTELLTGGIDGVNTPTSLLDYFRTQYTSGFSSQIHLGNSVPTAPLQVISGELQPFCVTDGQFPPAVGQQGVTGDYNINSKISFSGLAGFNRGTLQSNLPHGYSPAVSATQVTENYRHHRHQFSDGRLQLCHSGDGTWFFDRKGKGNK